ncbi:unnamed protein product, partial [marine sediment metagenome]
IRACMERSIAVVDAARNGEKNRKNNKFVFKFVRLKKILSIKK